jgi:hypothetical protein
MRDSNVANAAKESAQDEFPHGLQDFNTVIGNPAAPFLNKLASEGMRFTNYDAIDHPSEPNYLALFSGSEQGLGGSDTVPTTLFTGATLASELAYYPGDTAKGERGGEIFGAARA